jgi:hypothetical protein
VKNEERRMKNLVFAGLFIAVVLCAVAFSACRQEDDPQKKITVTGIPAAHDGRFADIVLIDTDYPIAGNRLPVVISNGTVNISLIDPTDGLTSFTESGIFKVLFWIRDSTGVTTYFNGMIEDKPITEETTTIPFGDFTDIS